MAEITVCATEPGDYRAHHGIFSEPEVVRGTLQLPYPSLETWRKRLEAPPRDFYSLVACVGGEVVGHISLSVPACPRRDAAGGLGIVVREGWHGRVVRVGHKAGVARCPRRL